MGSASHLKPGEYSLRFNRFLVRVVQDVKSGRPTARWAEKNMPDARGKDYWEKLLKATQAMTTEDIAVISEWLDVDPFAFVRAVRDDDLAPFLPLSNVVPFPQTPSEEEAIEEQAVAKVNPIEQPEIDATGPEEGA